MHKKVNRILSTLLVLVMVLSMLPAAVFATGETESVFRGWSLTLGDNIGVNFYLAEEAANYSVNVTVAGNAAATTAESVDGSYVVTANIAAAQMTDTVALSVVNGEETLHSGEYTVRQYAESVLTGEYDTEVQEMVKQMLNYGAAAQTYFSYNTENLANDGYELESAATVPTEVPEIDVQDNLSGIALYGMSLLFRNKTGVRFYFYGSDDMNSYSFKVGETAYTPVAKGGQYYVQIDGIIPQNLDETIELVVSKDDATLTVSYSPVSYIIRKYNSADSSESLKALVQSMYGYHLEAVEYQAYEAIIRVGTLQQSSNTTPWVANENETFIDFDTVAYTATTGEYTSLTADAIKLVRGGETYSVANPGQGLLIKESDTGHKLKITPWGMTGGYLPIQAHDYFIIEGRFVSTSGDGTTIEIDKSYIYYDGTNVEVSATEPTLPVTVSAGVMQSHSNSHGDYGIYFSLDANDAPYSGWDYEYTQTSADNLKLIRDGETVSIGIVDRPLIVKYGETDYYLKLEQWNIGSTYGMNGGTDPITTDDVLIVEGDFKNGDVTLNISKSYVYYNGSAWVCSAATGDEYGEYLLPHSSEKITIGVWNGSYHVFEDKQLQELQAAGITKLVGIDTQWIGTTDVNGWLDRVYSYGISVIFDLRGWDGETIPDYASHSGVLGFLMYDEPSTQEFDELAALKAKFDAVDAFDGKLFYVNLLASCVADSSLFGDDYNSSQTDYDQYYVTEFLNKLDIQVLSWDSYSLISNADDTSDKGIRTDYFYNFEVMANQAKTNDLPLWYIMLASGHTSGAENTVYNTPTEEELRWQMAVALTYGVKNIDQYVYVSHESDYSTMVEYDTWEPTDLYYDIKTVNNEYLAWDNIFTAYSWVGVGKYSANSKDTMLDNLENPLDYSAHGISSISAGENLLVGVYDYNGQNAYMVTNAGSVSTGWFTGYVGDGREFDMADTTVTLTLDSADYKCVAIIDNGEISYVAVENNTVTLNVQAYEGVFVIPVLN